MFGPVFLTLSSFQGFIIFQFQTTRYEMSCKFVEITVKTTLPVKVKCLRFQTKVAIGYCGRGLR